jgi:hypothetical protein
MVDPTFPNFSLLPIEIRLNIWQCANARRTIFLRIYEDPSEKHLCFSIKAATPPALLAVCRESRHETLTSHIAVRIYNKPRFYLNPALDTLYFFRSPGSINDYPVHGPDWLATLRSVQVSQPVLPVDVYVDLDRRYLPTLVIWEKKGPVVVLEPFMLAKLSSGAWNVWALESTRDGRLTTYDQGEEPLEEPRIEFYDDVVTPSATLETRFPDCGTLKDLWDFRGLGLAGTLR